MTRTVGLRGPLVVSNGLSTRVSKDVRNRLVCVHNAGTLGTRVRGLRTHGTSRPFVSSLHGLRSDSSLLGKLGVHRRRITICHRSKRIGPPRSPVGPGGVSVCTVNTLLNFVIKILLTLLEIFVLQGVIRARK